MWEQGQATSSKGISRGEKHLKARFEMQEHSANKNYVLICLNYIN